MDGYASVKENLGSSVEEQIKYNVEAEGSVMTLAMRDQVRRVTRLWHKVAHKVDKCLFCLLQAMKKHLKEMQFFGPVRGSKECAGAHLQLKL